MTASSRPRRRRADAERSISRIVTAAREQLSANPDASVDDIAKAAGVGRMTLYGHFPSRAALVEAALADALKDGDAALSAVDLTGDARDAMTRLLESSWSLVAQSKSLLAAAQESLPAGRVRDLHADPADRVEALIRRGQRQGVFRTDLPVTWLVSVAQFVLHGAADEVRAGRLAADEVTPAVITTIMSILDAPRATRGRRRAAGP